MRDNPDCKAIRINDEMCCAKCGLSWAVEDTDRPECIEMKIPPISPTPQLAWNPRPSAQPENQAFVCRVVDATGHTPRRSFGIVVFAPSQDVAWRTASTIMSRPQNWRQLDIEIYADHVDELDVMGRDTRSHAVFRQDEMLNIMSLLARTNNMHIAHNVKLLPVFLALQELKSWVK